MTRPTIYHREFRPAPVAPLVVTSIPTEGVGSYTRSPIVGVATTSRTPWEGPSVFPSAIATTSISSVDTLFVTTVVVGRIHILTFLRRSWITLS